MLIKYIILGVVVVLVIVILFTSYVKAPPNKAYIISGIRKKPKVLIGRAGLKLPFFERKDELLIEPYIAFRKYRSGDVYLVCSDGLTDMVPEEEIGRILAERRAVWKPKPRKYRTGVLRLFGEHAASAMKGAYLDWDEDSSCSE